MERHDDNRWRTSLVVAADVYDQYWGQEETGSYTIALQGRWCRCRGREELGGRRRGGVKRGKLTVKKVVKSCGGSERSARRSCGVRYEIVNVGVSVIAMRVVVCLLGVCALQVQQRKICAREQEGDAVCHMTANGTLLLRVRDRRVGKWYKTSQRVKGPTRQ